MSMAEQVLSLKQSFSPSHVLPANTPLSKVSHVAKPEGKRKKSTFRSLRDWRGLSISEQDSITARIENPIMLYLLLRNPSLLETSKEDFLRTPCFFLFPIPNYDQDASIDTIDIL